MIFERDVLSIVKATSFEEGWNSDVLIIRDVKILLHRVNEWSIRHVPRTINNVANVLAKNALCH